MNTILIALAAFFCITTTSFAQVIKTANGKDATIEKTVPMGRNVFAATSRGVFRSADSGQTWIPVNKGLHSELSDNQLIVNSLFVKSDTLYSVISVDGGMFVTTGDATEWREININAAREPNISSCALFGNTFYAGTAKGVFRSSDNGVSWTHVPETGTGEIKRVVTNSNYIVVEGYKVLNKEPFYSSADGKTWNKIGGIDFEINKVEVAGNNIIARRYGTDNSEGRACEYAYEIFVLSKNGKQWIEIKERPAYFGFDGDKIYAIKVTIEENRKKQFIYTVDVTMTEDMGKHWQDVDDTDAFLVTDYGMQQVLTRMYAEKEESIQHAIVFRTALVEAKAKNKARRAEMKGTGGSDYKFYGPAPSSTSSPDYRALSNDRFKQQNNRRDTWMDSKGQIHRN